MILRCKGTKNNWNMQGKLQFLLVVSKKNSNFAANFEDIVIEI
jgi:hypothetical protein